MKIRSKALYDYLQQTGALHSTPEAMSLAKKQYRRLYKKRWKQQNRPRKELRIEVTLKQYAIIKTTAKQYQQNTTAYARSAILAATDQEPHIARKDALLQVLQLVSMATIATIKNTVPLSHITELLEQAESMLLEYMNIHTLQT